MVTPQGHRGRIIRHTPKAVKGLPQGPHSDLTLSNRIRSPHVTALAEVTAAEAAFAPAALGTAENTG
jgi:hypothetical protein